MKTVTVGLVGVGRIGEMHAQNLLAVRTQLADRDVQLDVVLADADRQVACQVGDQLGLRAADSVEALIAEGIDGLIIAANTATHPDLIHAGLVTGIPIFCEKPISSDAVGALALLKEIEAMSGVVQIGYQRRFDVGYQEAKRRFDTGELGWLHSLRAVSGDAFPPAVNYLATSGGIFRDMSVHDFDVIRWLTSQEIVEVYARGSNNGDSAIGAVGDVDTGHAILTLADGTVATALATRYNGAGHDVRLEVQGAEDTAVAGLDARSALRSAESGVEFPGGAAYATFAERFADAYVAELLAFIELVLGERANPCPAFEAVAASLVADAAQLSLTRGEPVIVPSLRDILDGAADPIPSVDLIPASE